MAVWGEIRLLEIVRICGGAETWDDTGLVAGVTYYGGAHQSIYLSNLPSRYMHQPNSLDSLINGTHTDLFT